MKVAVIGSRNAIVNDIEKFLPSDTSEIVSGGAKGIDSCAKEYALKNGIKLTEFLPQYERFGRVAPLKRNLEIINYSDTVIAFWDGKSKGTEYVIKNCIKMGKPIKIVEL